MKLFIDIPAAAKRAGYSLRHFRRIIDTEHIPVIKMSRGRRQKFFLLVSELDKWLGRTA